MLYLGYETNIHYFLKFDNDYVVCRKLYDFLYENKKLDIKPHPAVLVFNITNNKVICVYVQNFFNSFNVPKNEDLIKTFKSLLMIRRLSNKKNNVSINFIDDIFTFYYDDKDYSIDEI